MSQGLKKHKLSEVSEVIRGVSFGSSEGQPAAAQGYLPVLRAGNIQDRLNLDNDLVWVPEARISSKQLVRQHDIVMCTSSGSASVVGKCARADSDWQGSFGAFCAGIRAKASKCDPGYLFHYLRSPAFTSWSSKSAGANIKNIRKSELEDFQIPLPPLPEQRRIAVVLDKADTVRRKRQETIRLTEEFLRSVFLDVFGDPVTNPKGWCQNPLGSICDVGSSTRVFVNELVDSGVPFYRGTEIGQLGDGQLVNPNLFITKEHYERLKAQSGVPRKGDLLLPSICPDGRIYLVKNDEEFYFKDGRVLWIKAGDSPVNSVFLRHHLKQLFIAYYSKIASGTTFAELKIFALKDLVIHVPPIEVQERFASVAVGLEKLSDHYSDSLNNFNNLFSLTVQKAFRGDL